MTEPEHKRKTQEQKNDKEVFTFVDLSLEESSGSMPMYCGITEAKSRKEDGGQQKKGEREDLLSFYEEMGWII